MGISLSDMFFAATEETLSYEQILEDVQKYCTEIGRASCRERVFRAV